MIPLLLEFEWIGSYIEKTVFDFTVIPENVFLISGKTGSGKTTILDAMTYALYGESSGGDRTVPVSQFITDKKAVPYISFTLDIGGERYRFTRKYIRSSSGYSPSGECLKAVKTELGEVWEPYVDSTRSSDLTAAAEELLGLNAEQFRQVVILPQGKCERLLTGKSKDKEAVLSTLFNADMYNVVTEQLGKQALDMRRETEYIRQSCETMLAAHDFEDIQSAEEALKIDKSRSAELAETLALRKAAKEAADKARTSGAAAANRFKALDEAAGRLKALKSESSRHSFDGERIKRLKCEAEVLTVYDVWLKAQSEYSRRKLAAQSALSELKCARQAAEAASKSLRVHSDRSEQNEKLTAEITRLGFLRDSYIRLGESERELKKLLADGKAMRICCDKAAEQLNNIVRIIGELSESEAAAEKEITDLSGLTERYYEFGASAKSADELKSLQEELVHRSNEISRLEKLTKKLEADEKAAEAANAELHGRYISELSARLAAGLHKGDRCPVCGNNVDDSFEPCAHKTGGFVSEEELELSDNALAGMKKQHSAAAAELESHQAVRARLSENAEKIKLMLEQTGYSDGLYAQISAGYEAAVRRSKELERIREKKREQENNRLAAEKLLNDKKKLLDGLRMSYAAANERFSALRADIDPQIPTLEALDGKIAEYSDETLRYKKRLEELTSENAAALTALAKAESAEKLAREEFESADKAVMEAEGIADGVLADHGLPPCGEFTPDRDGIAGLDELRKEYDEFERRIKSAEELYAEVAAELDGAERPDTAALEKAYSEADILCMQTEKELSLCNADIERLENLLEKYSVLSHKYSEQSEICARREEFAKLIKGSRDVSFTRYVLGILIDMVTDEANHMLAEKMGGRFRISRSGEDAAARGYKAVGTKGSKGLDFVAESFLSDERSALFDVRQLSGGEKFQISLVLAVALSRVIQTHFGTAAADAMFIDEGFGSLDPDSLSEAVDVVNSVCDNRMVGIISHVEALKSHINCVVEVEKGNFGSRLSFLKT